MNNLVKKDFLKMSPNILFAVLSLLGGNTILAFIKATDGIIETNIILFVAFMLTLINSSISTDHILGIDETLISVGAKAEDIVGSKFLFSVILNLGYLLLLFLYTLLLLKISRVKDFLFLASFILSSTSLIILITYWLRIKDNLTYLIKAIIPSLIYSGILIYLYLNINSLDTGIYLAYLVISIIYVYIIKRVSVDIFKKIEY